MSYADRAAEHRRKWNERADAGEQLAAEVPEMGVFLQKAVRDARRTARRPYWLVWALELLGHWTAPLVMFAGLWVWWLTDDFLDGWFWLIAVGFTLLMTAATLINYRLHRRIAAERRRFQEWSRR